MKFSIICFILVGVLIFTLEIQAASNFYSKICGNRAFGESVGSNEPGVCGRYTCWGNGRISMIGY